MSATTHAGPHVRALAPSIRHAVARIADLALLPSRILERRRNMAVLSGLNDHELRDIGLTRGDIVSVSGLPMAADPTDALAALVQERRRWRRGR